MQSNESEAFPKGEIGNHWRRMIGYTEYTRDAKGRKNNQTADCSSFDSIS